MSDTINNSDELDKLKLYPEQAVIFPLKGKLKRSEILDFEGNEFDEQCIAYAEGDNISNEQSVINEARGYARLRLKVDTTLTMPGKDGLKKKAHMPLYYRLWLAVPVAVVLLIGFFIVNRNSETAENIKIEADVKVPVISKTEQITINENNAKQRLIKDEIVVKGDKHANVIKSVNKIDKEILQTSETLHENNVADDGKNKMHIEDNELDNSSATSNNKLYATIIEPVKIQTIPVKVQESNSKVDISEISQTLIAQNEPVEYDIIEIVNRGDEYEQPMRESFFRKIGNLISGRKDDNSEESWLDVRLQKKIIDVNSLIGKNSTVIKDYDENGKLISTQIASTGLTYNRQYASSDIKAEVYIVEHQTQ
jgi:hypothetical protein